MGVCGEVGDEVLDEVEGDVGAEAFVAVQGARDVHLGLFFSWHTLVTNCDDINLATFSLPLVIFRNSALLLLPIPNSKHLLRRLQFHNATILRCQLF